MFETELQRQSFNETETECNIPLTLTTTLENPFSATPNFADTLYKGYLWRRNSGGGGGGGGGSWGCVPVPRGWP